MPPKKEVELSGRQLIEAFRSDEAKVNAIGKRQQALQNMLGEMAVAAEAAREIHKTAKDENALVHLGAGVYAEAKITNVKKVKNSLAGNVLIDMPANSAAAQLEEEIKKTREEISALQKERQVVEQNMRNIAAVIEQGRRSVQGQGNELQSVS